MIPYRKIADTPWLWAGRTKEVKTSGDSNDPGGYRRLAAIEERVYTRSVRRKSKPFYFVYRLIAISVPDTLKRL